MWKCKHCNNEYNFKTTSEKANHTRWCNKNPKRNDWNSGTGTINQFGELKYYMVKCDCCGNDFEVKEREKLHPQKEKYYCSRSCANSIGG